MRLTSTYVHDVIQDKLYKAKMKLLIYRDPLAQHTRELKCFMDIGTMNGTSTSNSRIRVTDRNNTINGTYGIS